ncbi:hypothetical protein [Sporomusa sp. KB1]|jgi:hypothetical protein|uniref:hypothetical protein n=1 Tax=Sporomusa sp. KB1 TaxID=943346 RepID=UPI0011A6D290|nr:hypothetical protein [Sporomusa sp. KB1]TWH51739.1 hypothetical protein Salpa_0204 [Sporomusa sp. KB1]
MYRKKGSPVIAFTITAVGDIQENSLRVRKSALDASPLKAARVSAPFEKPSFDNDLDMVIAVRFVAD